MGNGIIKVPVGQVIGSYFGPDNGVTTPRIKHLLTGTTYNAPLIAGTGSYVADNGGLGCIPGRYVFMDNATVLNNVLGSEAQGGTWYGSDNLNYLPLVAGNYFADNKRITDLADAINPGDALNKAQGDSLYLLASILADLVDRTSNQTISGTKTFDILLANQFGSNISMAGNMLSGLVYPGEAFGSAAVPQSWIKAWVADAISSISVTPFQESPNKIRLIPGGSTKTGQVYTSWNDAAGYFQSLTPSATKRFLIEVCGMGITGSTSIPIASNDGGLFPTNYFNNYISYFIPNRFIKLLIPNDGMSVTDLGMTSVEGGTMFIDDIAATPTFTNLHFVNVYFDMVCASVAFINCKFENCFVKVNDDSDGTATFTDCLGSGTTSNQEIPSTLTGWGEKPKADF